MTAHYNPNLDSDRRSPRNGIINALKDVKWLLSLLVIYFLASGWGFETPNDKFSMVSRRLDNIEARVDSFAEMKALIEATAVIGCMSIPEEQAVQHRLPCRRLLEAYVSPLSRNRSTATTR